MSYLNAVRLVFSGQFQADPSTVNNDVRHFDNAAFEPQWQDYGMDAGWWNPDGSGAFRLINCVVRAVHYADGTSTDKPSEDPVVGLAVLNANSRSSGKIVDLDPQWQLASQIWGMQVRLAEIRDNATVTYVGGEFLVHPFRDLWFSRVSGKGGDGAASAIFQSTLANLHWGSNLPDSKFLGQLQSALQEGQLSIRLVTYAYKDSATKPGFTLGTVSGVIGPYLAGEPKSFVVGRRFAPQFGGTSWNNISFLTGVLGPDNRLLLDLCNALPIDANYNPLNLGTLTVGSLLTPSSPEGAPLGVGSYQQIGTIPYLEPDWLLKSAGIADLPLSPAMQGNQSPGGFAPLAIAAQTGPGPALIAIRETANGLFTGAEPFVLRIDSSNDGPVTATSTLYAAAYGQPLPFAQLQAAQTGEMDGLGTGSIGPDIQAIPVPPAGIPMSALNFPAGLATGADGTAVLQIVATPPNNPRGYIDGQLYNITYQQAGQPRSDFGPFELIAIHLRDAYPVPATPTWADNIQPIFAQYGNLYPIMSKLVVRLSDPASVYEHRNLLTLAFSLDICDPNYMPVTRDLSQGKRETILKWLARIEQDSAFMALVNAAIAVAPPALKAARMAADAEAEPPGGKTTFARSLARSRAST
jgi:hypothetical protein